MRETLTSSHLTSKMRTMAHTYGYSPISSDSRVRILALLGEGTDRTIDELTDALGLHPNTVREHVNRLIAQGHILQHLDRRKTRGRPRLLFRLATGLPGASSPIIRSKVVAAARRGDLMRRLMPETIAHGLTLEEMHQLDAISEHLEETGFGADVEEADLEIHISDCVHAEDAATRNSRCAVHLMMMQSVLAEAGGNLTVSEVLPAASDGVCVVQLLRTMQPADA